MEGKRVCFEGYKGTIRYDGIVENKGEYFGIEWVKKFGFVQK